MPVFIAILLATTIVSLGSLVGILTLPIKEKKLSQILLFLISLSAGAMMGGAFIHLLPEAAENFGSEDLFIAILVSFSLFFLIEKILHWRHCHKGICKVHTFGYMNLLGDSIHNFIDGLVIAAAFVTDMKLGLVTTLAVTLHEIPQEIGDFGVLLYSRFSKQKALLANFLTAIIAVAGGIAGYFLSTQINGLISYLLPFAAGGFLYISASDLMPEIRKEVSLTKSLTAFSIFLAGIVMMYLLKFVGI